MELPLPNFDNDFDKLGSEASWIHAHFPPSEKSALFLWQRIKIMALKHGAMFGGEFVVPLASFCRAAGVRTKASRDRAIAWLETLNLFSIKKGNGSYTVFTPTPLAKHWITQQT